MGLLFSHVYPMSGRSSERHIAERVECPNAEQAYGYRVRVSVNPVGIPAFGPPAPTRLLLMNIIKVA